MVLAALGAVFILFRALSRNSADSTDSSNRVSIGGAKATTDLNREFTFAINDSKGKKLTDLKMFLENADLRDEIIVQGKRATAIQGRTFLILTIKITNDYTRGLEVNSKDYFRLIVNGKDSDLLAPDIHNDPVVVQPTSTKYTRIGWPIYDSDKSLVLSVGEIEGEKTKVELNLQQ